MNGPLPELDALRAENMRMHQFILVRTAQLDEAEMMIEELILNVPGVATYLINEWGFEPDKTGKEMAEIARLASEQAEMAVCS